MNNIQEKQEEFISNRCRNFKYFLYFCVMDKTLKTLEAFTSSWKYNLELGKELNTSLSIGFSDSQVESLTCLENGLKGTGSISHGNDHNDGSETKFANKVQPKDCSRCGKKVHFFLDICDCGSNLFDYHTDARWGLDTKAHFEYKVPAYHLWVLAPVKYSSDCKNFTLHQYYINSENDSFNKILEGQFLSPKSKSKNFMPYQLDFYCSNPIMKSNFAIEITNEGVSVVRKLCSTIEYNSYILEIMKKVISNTFQNTKDTYLYEEIEPHLNVENKKRSYGKERGTTTRRKQ